MRTITKRAIQAAAAATIAFGGLVAFTGSASAYGNTDHWLTGHDYWLQNQNTGRCVDDSNQSWGNWLRAFPCYQNSYNGGWQKWRVTQQDGSGYAQLYNMNTGLCLDDSTDQYGNDVLRGFPCYQNSFNGGWQKWRIVNRYTSAGAYQQVLVNGNTGRCLDDSTGSSGNDVLRGYPCNGGSQDGLWQGWNVFQMD